MMNFTNDEMNLMCIYQSDSRSGLIAALTEMRGYLDEDEAELRELTDSSLQKLSEITDEDFAALELVPEVSPQAAKVAHSRASAITMARIFLNFIQNSPSVFPEYKNL